MTMTRWALEFERKLTCARFVARRIKGANDASDLGLAGEHSQSRYTTAKTG